MTKKYSSSITRTTILAVVALTLALCTFGVQVEASGFGVGYALRFENKDFIDFSKSISFGGSYSIEFNVRYRQPGPVIYLGEGSDKADKISVSVESGGKVKLTHCSRKDCDSVTTASGAVTQNQWSWVGISVANLILTSIVTIYTQDANGHVNSIMLQVMMPVGYSSRSVVWIGKEKNNYIDADLDEIRLWNRIILPIVEGGRDRSISNSDRNLVARWSFNEGQGNTALDSSTNGKHGSLGGGNSNNAPEYLDATVVKTSSCSAWGKRIHLYTFDKRWLEQKSCGDYWFARSTLGGSTPKVEVQLRVIHQATRRGGAVGGLAFRYGSDTVFIDLNFNDNADSTLYVNSVKRSETDFTLASGIIVDKEYKGRSRHTINIDVGGVYKLYIIANPRSRRSAVSIRLSNPPYGDGVTGFCGDFDTNRNNDSPASGTAIAAGESLFPNTIPPESLGTYDCNINDVTDTELRNQANSICNNPNVVDAELKDSCYYDVCITGDISGASEAAQQSYEACVESIDNENSNDVCTAPCLDFCSFHGTCTVNTTCACAPGWYGPDCSQQSSFPCYKATWNNGNSEFDLYPFKGARSVESHFDYKWLASRTGNEIADTSVLYLYDDTRDNTTISMVLLHDKENDGSGGRATTRFVAYRPGTLPQQRLPLTIAARDDPKKDTFNTGTFGQVDASWEWSSCDSDGVALSGLPQSSAFCVDVTMNLQEGIDQVYLSNENQFGAQDLQKVSLQELAGLKICGDQCSNQCGMYSNCGQCTGDSSCGWCADSGTCEFGDAGGPRDGRCRQWRYSTSPSVSRVSSSELSFPVDPVNVQVYLAGSDNLDAQFSVTLPSFENTPQDVVLIQDLTKSFAADVRQLGSLAQKWYESVDKTFPNTRAGIVGIVGGSQPFKSLQSLTTSKSALKSVLNNVDSSQVSNTPPTSAQLDVLLRAVTGTEMGWSVGNAGRRVAIVITKTNFASSSANAAKAALLENNVVPVFIVPDGSVFNSYQNLVNSWKFGYVLSFSSSRVESAFSQAQSALTLVGSSVSAVLKTAGRVSTVSPPSYSGISPLTRVFFAARLDSSSTSTQNAEIVIPGYGKVTVSYLATDRPVANVCPFSNITTTDRAILTLGGSSPVYQGAVRAKIESPLPASGTVYQYSNGQLGAPLAVGDTVSDAGNRVIYVPDAALSSTTSVSVIYKLADDCDSCSDVVSCNILINVAVQPPVAVFNNPLVALENRVSDPTPLPGSGVGQVRARISRFPERGSLFQVDWQPLNDSHPVVIDTSNRVLFKPIPNQYGNNPGNFYTHFSYVVQDSATSLESQEETVYVVVPPLPRPTASNGLAELQEDIEETFALTGANGNSSNTAPLRYFIASRPEATLVKLFDGATELPASGDYELSGNQVRVVPQSNQHGSTQFTFYVIDVEQLQSDNAVVSVTVEPVNDVPTAGPLSFEVVQDAETPIALTGGSDVEGGSLTYFICDWNGRGTLRTGSGVISKPAHNVDLTGSLFYTSPQYLAGDDSFTFAVRDSQGSPSPCYTASISIQAVNYPPVAMNLELVTDENSVLHVQLSATDYNVGDHLLTFTITQVPATGAELVQSGGSVVINPQDTVTSVTGSNYNSFGAVDFRLTQVHADNTTYSFTYCVSDGVAPDSCASVSIFVIVAVKIPQAVAPVSPVAVNEDEDVDIVFSGTIEAPIGAELSFKLLAFGPGRFYQVDSAGDRALEILNNNTFVEELNTINFQPDAQLFGVGYSYFYYQVVYNNLVSSPVYVRIDVNSVNDRPLVNDVTLTTNENQDILITLSGWDQEDGQNVDFQLVSLPAGELFFCDSSSVCTTAASTSGLTPTATLLYSPPQDTFGYPVATFTYRSVDSDSATSDDFGTVTINANHVNRPPVVPAVDREYHIDSDDSIDVFLDGSDPNDATGLAAIIVQVPTRGTLKQFSTSDQITQTNTTVTVNRTVTFEAERVTDSDPVIFTYILQDNEGASSLEGVIRIYITNVANPPTAVSQNAPGSEDVMFTITLAGADYDNPSSTLTATITVAPQQGNLFQFDGVTPLTTGAVSDGSRRVKFLGDPNEFGSSYASFNFTITSSETGLVSEPATVAISLANDNSDPPQPVCPTAPVSFNEDEMHLVLVGGYDPDETSFDAFMLQGLRSTIDGSQIGNVYQVNSDGSVGALMNLDGVIARKVLNASHYVWMQSLPNKNGQATFSYYLRDPTALESNILALSATIVAVNDAPVAAGINQLIDNTPGPQQLFLSYSDVDNTLGQLSFNVTKFPVLGNLYRDLGNNQVGTEITPANPQVVGKNTMFYVRPFDDDYGANYANYTYVVTDPSGLSSSAVTDQISTREVVFYPNIVSSPASLAVTEGQTNAIQFTVTLEIPSPWPASQDYWASLALDFYLPSAGALGTFPDYEGQSYYGNFYTVPTNESIISLQHPDADPFYYTYDYTITYLPWPNADAVTQDQIIWRACYYNVIGMNLCRRNQTIPITIAPVNDAPRISLAGSTTSGPDTVTARVAVEDPDVTDGSGHFSATVTVVSGAVSISPRAVATGTTVNVISATSFSLDSTSLFSLQQTLNEEAGGVSLQFTSGATEAVFSVAVNDHGNVGGTAITTTTQFTLPFASGFAVSEPGLAEAGTLTGALVGGTTVLSAGLYGVYAVLKKKKLLPEDADPWETDDMFDQTLDNPLYSGTGATTATASVTLVTSDN